MVQTSKFSVSIWRFAKLLYAYLISNRAYPNRRGLPVGATISEQLLKVANDLSSLADTLVDEVGDDKFPLDQFIELLGVTTRLHQLGLQHRTENELEPQL